MTSKSHLSAVTANLAMCAGRLMTNEQVRKLSLIFRQAREVVKNSIDEIAQLAENALILFSEDRLMKEQSFLLPSQSQELLTKKELADRWKVSERTISNLQTRGLPSILFGKSIRFDYEDCLTWAKNRKVEKRGKTNLRVIK